MERKNLEEEKIKEALKEKKPVWQLYYGLEDDDKASVMTKEYWTQLIDGEFEKRVGDEDERWNSMRQDFKLEQSLNKFEEFDGLNHFDAKYMVLMVALPLLVRGTGVAIQVLDDIFTLRVQNLYRL